MTRYVVDVFIPIAIEVYAQDAEMAESMAEDMLNESPVRARINAVVDEDVDTAFVISDSEPHFKAGEA